MAICSVCFRHCSIAEGQLGFCGGRTARGGRVEAFNYGRITALALDPIEKKPLARFFPGSKILSVGSFGCNLRCPFCQNHAISWSEQAKRYAKTAEKISPEDLTTLAESTRQRGNIGIAFTYNEPLIGYEFVRDTAKLAKTRELKTVIVTNGTAELGVLEELKRSRLPGGPRRKPSASHEGHRRSGKDLSRGAYDADRPGGKRRRRGDARAFPMGRQDEELRRFGRALTRHEILSAVSHAGSGSDRRKNGVSSRRDRPGSG